MTHSPLTNEIRLSSQSSSRQGAKIDRFIVHHAASTNHDGVVNMMVNRTRQVSANYVVSEKITCVVDEILRAWTSGSSADGGKGAAFDRRAITVETINAVGAPSWAVSDKTFDNLARLIANSADRYGFDINDDTVLTHQELWNRFRASYATACPGDLQRRKGELINLARTYRGQTPIPAAPATPAATPGKLAVDGELWKATISALQRTLGTFVDGVISEPYSALVAALQRHLNARGARDWDGRVLEVDGKGLYHNSGRRVGKTRTIWALQAHLGTPTDGFLDANDSQAVRRMQERLNAGTF